MYPFVSSFNILVTVIAHVHQPLPIHSETDSLEQLPTQFILWLAQLHRQGCTAV